ncbi:MAG: hypothetical protein ACXACA_03550 [Candidatus Ranarchaeia archaeon]|jgi:hypothetical protein
MTQNTLYESKDIVAGKINFLGITHQYIIVRGDLKSRKEIENFGQALNILGKAGWTLRHFFNFYAILEKTRYPPILK